MRIRNPFRKRDLRSVRDPFEVQGRLFDAAGPLTIFDVGAYVGSTAQAYRQAFPQAAIFCFEPFPDSFEKLRTSCQHPSIRPHPVALSNRRGTTTFYVNADTSCNSTLPLHQGAAGYRRSECQNVREIEVPTLTLDAFCDEAHVDHIDILKMDVEGAEIAVLEGAAQRLKDQRIDLIFTEVMFTPHYEGGCLFHETSAFLSGYGYSLFNFYQLRTARNGQLLWGNAIFLGSRLRAGLENTTAVGAR